MGLAPPSYWETMDADGPPWRVVAASPEESEVLKLAMVSGASLGGRDQRSPLTYKGFALHAAWRVQHPGLWGKYAMERENLRKIDLKSLPSVERVKLRQEFVDVASRLPAALDSQLNEVFLSHGTRPESILAILSGGLNERFSGGLFGNGTYLAEDIGKNDQYCTPDKSLGEHKELHKLLFDDTGIQHPGNLCYILVCRALLGCYIRTKDGDRDLDASRSIWSSAQRELALIPDSNPPVLHHSLIAETGGRIARFREFIIYHGARIYPEYLVAYRRV
ncbi:unnamed protein product [Effrenium voratum]|nr:unnamed protein product [Effrenium voratum]